MHVVEDTRRDPGLHVKGAVIPTFGQYVRPEHAVQAASAGLLEYVPAEH